MAGKENSKKVITVKANEVLLDGTEKSTTISYTDLKNIGNGSFGTVFQAFLRERNEIIAIKKVLQSPVYRNRELNIMKSIRHVNIVYLHYYFFTTGDKDTVYLHLVLEYIPETIYRVVRNYRSQKQQLPMFYVRLYMYQLFRSLAYLHNKNICHRDIKSQNLLCNPVTGVLKLCDFGCAKTLVPTEANVSYICSRYYRAPELLFNAVKYTCQIDVWSSGCILSELLSGQPIFLGDSALNQLVEIVKILGTPTNEQILLMNPDYQQYTFPQINAKPWKRVFKTCNSPEAIGLISCLLVYQPNERLTALDALAHPLFDELRQPGLIMPDGKPIPPLFNFTEKEIAMKPSLFQQKLIPPHAQHVNEEHDSTNSQQTTNGLGAQRVSSQQATTSSHETY